MLLLLDHLLSGPVEIRNVTLRDITQAAKSDPTPEPKTEIDKRLAAARKAAFPEKPKPKFDPSRSLPESPHPQQAEQIVVTLPFTTKSYHPQGRYAFSFRFQSRPWDYIMPLRLQADNCFGTLTFDGKAAGGSNCLSDIHLFDVKNTIEGTLYDDGNIFGLKIVREHLFSKKIAVALGAFAVTLLFLSLHDTWPRALRSIHVLLLCAVFAGSLFSYSNIKWWAFIYDVYDWRAAFTLVSSGVMMFLVFLLLWHWPPAGMLHEYALRKLKRIAVWRPQKVALSCTLLFFLVALFLAQAVFSGVPHVADTHLQYVLGKVFASGHVVASSHELPRFFDFQFTINDGKFYPHYFPGQAMLLAIGHLIHLPWIINPLFGALAVYMVFLLARELADERAGMLAALLMLVSPHALFLSAEYMSHVSCMFFLTAFCYCYLRTIRTQELHYAMLAGAAVGFALLIRPQTTIPFAFPIAVHAAWYFLRALRSRFLPLLVMASSFSVFAAMLLYYNNATAGSPWLTPYDRTQPVDSGFLYRFSSPERWLAIGSDIERALGNITSMHIDLLGWPTTPFIVILLMYIFRLQPRHATLLLMTLFSLFVSMVFFNPFSTNVFPSRYSYETIGVLIALIAIGILRIPDIAERISGVRSAAVASSLALTIALCVALAWPYRAGELYRMYSSNYWEGNANYVRMLVDSTQAPAIIFMKNYNEYRFAYFLREADMGKGDRLFVRDRGTDNKRLMDYYPDRHIYYVQGGRIQKLR